MTTPIITIKDEIAEVRLEIRKRLQVYPRLVVTGTMTEDEAQHKVAAMTHVLQRLEALRQLSLFGKEA